MISRQDILAASSANSLIEIRELEWVPFFICSQWVLKSCGLRRWIPFCQPDELLTTSLLILYSKQYHICFCALYPRSGWEIPCLFVYVLMTNLFSLSNRGLKLIEPCSFTGLANLKHLDLSRNELRTVPDLNLPKLQKLNIEENLVQDLTFLRFYNNLTDLWVVGNPLTVSTMLSAEIIERVSPLLWDYYAH